MPKTKETKQTKATGAAASEEEGKTARAGMSKKALRGAKRRKKCSGLRKKAVQAGFINGSLIASAGQDQLKALITRSNIRNMVTFVPERIAEEGGYDKDEFEERLATANAKFSTGAFDVLVPKVESIFRAVTTEALTRSLEFGKTSIDATTMASVLRPYQGNTLFDTQAPPRGILQFAQTKGALAVTEEDAEQKKTREAQAKEMQKAADAAEAAREKLKQARRDKFKESGRQPGVKSSKKQKA